MQNIPGIEFLSGFVDKYAQQGVESTGAVLLDFVPGLYNVEGSRDDPKIGGLKWKPLLIVKGVSADSPCYVTNAGAQGSHPGFSVGGHMTTNNDGSVSADGICYLMPLCSWHNSKARDRVLFSHNLTLMLQLSGYMEGELAATFQARLPSDDQFSMVYFSQDDWHHQNLSNEQAIHISSKKPTNLVGDCETKHFILFERVPEKNQIVNVIRDVQLPGR